MPWRTAQILPIKEAVELNIMPKERADQEMCQTCFADSSASPANYVLVAHEYPEKNVYLCEGCVATIRGSTAKLDLTDE